jgi:hypothetical protein
MSRDPGAAFLATGDPTVLKRRPNLIEEAEEKARALRQRRNTPTRDPWANAGKRFRAGHLQQLVDLVDAVCLDDHAADARRALTAAADLDHVTTDALEDLDAMRDRLTADVAAGRMTAIDAALELDRATSLSHAAPIARELTEEARTAIIRDAGQRLYDLGDKLVLELDQVVQQQADTITRNADKARSIVRDADASRSDTKTHTAWITLPAAVDRIEACWRLVDALRTRNLVETLPPPYVPASYWQYRNIDAFQNTWTRGMHRNWQMVAYVEAGAEPAVLTATELVERYL